ncbi:hypothetical protein OH810_31795 (plasmid) [Streptomyces albidoflavus]|uniref:hypothetical protein n=1 Tax=Streptomyces albidoflavus TaxID=1886 RepID=UPI002F90AE69|nr:hypothetical protein OH810_31795 [Streptomyces albidoflavus]
MTTIPAVDPYAVRDQAVHAWLMHATTHRYDARLTTWTHNVNAAGEPVWSAELAGADVETALPRFASTTRLPLRTDSDVLPGLSVELEGRVAVWWRQGGVWVELWHADPLPPAVTPIGGLWRRTVASLPKPGPNLFPQRHPACTCSPPDHSESAGPQYPDEDCPEHGNPDVLALPKTAFPTQTKETSR